ncbi:MAG: DUF885 domain-containing protein [Acidobacteria bacterium]|nr:MAG: DUF885 domain-containing protein [Acidobacteriota bacterium]
MNKDLRALADEYWEHVLRTNPTNAHMLGDYRYIDRFEDVSREAEDAEIAARRAFADRARSFRTSDLSSADRTTQETLIYEAASSAAVSEMRQGEFGIDPIFGPQVVADVLIPQMTVETAEHADGMLEKFDSFAQMLDQSTQRLREGIANGRVNAEFAVTKAVGQLDAVIAAPVENSPFLKAQIPESYSDEEATAWRDRAVAIVRNSINPAFERYRDVIRDEVGPVARSDEKAGLFGLDDGDLVYSRLLDKYTTLAMQAEEIHHIGLEQIEKLAGEYHEIAGPVLGTTSLEDIFRSLREDPDLHHTTGEGVIAASEAAFAKAKAEMGDWFGRLPKSDCFVQETKSGPVAFYFPPADDGSREGTFFMNTEDPTSWGTFEIEATAFHEGIPGHHLQIAIAHELGDAIPAFQRHAFISAYGEGWGLYTERLADEMGLYTSELDRIGMLQADSMRACRLVVDTGMHALGWSRQQGIDYVASNSPMTMHSIVEEIDRYLSYPGQAVSYMVGRIEIQRMRAEAEARMGDRFDIKSFHDAVLGSGLVTLPTLDRIVKEWSTS